MREPRRISAVLAYLAFALILFAVSAMFGSSLGPVAVGFGIVVGIVVILVAAMQLAAPGSLELTREGFAYTLAGQPYGHPWSAVNGFFTFERTTSFGARRSFVGIDFVAGRSDAQGNAAVRAANRMIAAKSVDSRMVAGERGMLPLTYGMDATELVALLEQWRRRYA